MRAWLLLVLLIWAAALFAQERALSVAEAAENALKQSKLTSAGSPPFHLKAEFAQPGNPASPYQAEVEEYWLGPDHWRRTIRSPEFSQTLIIDGSKVSEQDTGDYYPFWLEDLVTAIFEPLPMFEQLKTFKGQLEVPADSTESSSCLQFAAPVGIPPVRASAGYAFCFKGKLGLLQSVNTPGYKARFEDYKPYKGKQVSRRILAQLDSDTALEARITQLDEAVLEDRALFTVDQPTPPAKQLKSMQVAESIARNIAVSAPAIIWPPVREGRNSGTVSVYISSDRSGQVREVWPVASDNPELNLTVGQQLKQWRFQPYVNGAPMQMESLLTFAFSTMMGEPIPLLTNAQARRLATRVLEPRLTAKRGAPARFTVRIRVDRQGKVMRVLNPGNASPARFSAAERALKQWQFRPYLRDGQPDLFDADIVLRVP
jgi:outer membrane biosynthesis protein TonB